MNHHFQLSLRRINFMPNPLEVQIGGGHYKGFKIQPIEFIHANNIPFIEGSIIKYAARWRDKGGLQDIEKIKHYCDLLIKLEQQNYEDKNGWQINSITIDPRARENNNSWSLDREPDLPSDAPAEEHEGAVQHPEVH